MERRNGLLTFLTALVPGVGQMYLGLIKKGVQIFILFLLIRPVFTLIGIGFLAGIVKLVLWCYAFFDTLDTAKRLDRGEHISDTDYVFKKYMDGNHGSGFNFHGYTINKGFWIIGGWALIVVGILAIINLMFGTNELYGLIKSYVNTYFLPVALVVAGFFILFRTRR